MADEDLGWGFFLSGGGEDESGGQQVVSHDGWMWENVP
jgi:hypothetical protein